MRQAEVFSNGVLAGILSQTDLGDFNFKYVDTFLLDENETEISLTFPKSKKEFIAKTLFTFFYNMLSEGANKSIQCQTLRIDENDAFGLLIATAHSDTIGAITIKGI